MNGERVPPPRFGTRGDWTDGHPTARLRGMRRAHRADARLNRQMAVDDGFNRVEAASVAEVAELRMWQADVALKQRRA